jgi:hypothetical protein
MSRYAAVVKNNQDRSILLSGSVRGSYVTMTFSGNIPDGQFSKLNTWGQPRSEGIQQLFQDLSDVQNSFTEFKQYQQQRDAFMSLLDTLHSNN